MSHECATRNRQKSQPEVKDTEPTGKAQPQQWSFGDLSLYAPENVLDQTHRSTYRKIKIRFHPEGLQNPEVILSVVLGRGIHIKAESAQKSDLDQTWKQGGCRRLDRHFISVGGLISTLDPTCQADITSVAKVETTKTAFVRLLQLARRQRRLSLEQLAEKADVDLAELLKIETDETFTPALRTVHQLASVLDLPAKKLMVLAGLLQMKDPSLQQASVRFAARSEPSSDVSPEEHAALEEYVKFLNER